jgi:hypothetical protein
MESRAAPSNICSISSESSHPSIMIFRWSSISITMGSASANRHDVYQTTPMIHPVVNSPPGVHRSCIVDDEGSNWTTQKQREPARREDESIQVEEEVAKLLPEIPGT